MIGIAGEVRRQVEHIREWFISELLRQQKPELDRKIDEMLKPPRINRIIQRSFEGLNIGIRLSRRGLGKPIWRVFKALNRLL